MSNKKQKPETVAIHGGDYRSDPTTNAVAVPIYQTSSYQFNSAEHASNLFGFKDSDLGSFNLANIELLIKKNLVQKNLIKPLYIS